MNWNELTIFRGIDLSDSFVLSWSLGADELRFELEASIWPESKYYEPPKQNEYTCYKPAYLSFRNAAEVNGLLEMNQVRYSTDASGEKDYGNIDNLEKNNERFLVEGDFGTVTIVGGEMYFSVNET